MYSIEKQWQQFLKLVGLVENELPEIQRNSMKRAFFGGVAQMLVLLRDGIGAIEDENQSIAELENIDKELKDFWNAQK